MAYNIFNFVTCKDNINSITKELLYATEFLNYFISIDIYEQILLLHFCRW